MDKRDDCGVSMRSAAIGVGDTDSVQPDSVHPSHKHS